MKKWMRYLTLGIILLTLATAITGCNTVRGIGKDIEKGGQAIQDAADS